MTYKNTCGRTRKCLANGLHKTTIELANKGGALKRENQMIEKTLGNYIDSKSFRDRMQNYMKTRLISGRELDRRHQVLALHKRTSTSDKMLRTTLPS